MVRIEEGNRVAVMPYKARVSHSVGVATRVSLWSCPSLRMHPAMGATLS